MTATAAHPLAVSVIDDNQDAADSMALVLRAFGHDARPAHGPREAGRAVRDGFRPDAVLLDLDLPDMTGFEVARELCAALPRRPLLVAVTGHGSLDGRSHREGFDHHFLMPADPDELLWVLAAHAELLRTG